MPQRPRKPRPVEIGLTIPSALLDRLTADATAHGRDLAVHITTLLEQTAPPPRRVLAVSGKGRAVECRHGRTNPDPKLPGVRVCVDCSARLT